MEIRLLSPAQRDQAVSVLCDAFHDYPVMRYVIGDHKHYDSQLEHVIGFYVDLRYECRWPVLAVEHDGKNKAIALVNTPASDPWIESSSPAMLALCDKLDRDAVNRMVAFEEASAGGEPDYPHYFLGMLGVLHSARGEGYAHHLINHIIQESERDVTSRALVLTTECADNHVYYERQGFRKTSAVRVGSLTSSCFIRATLDPKTE